MCVHDIVVCHQSLADKISYLLIAIDQNLYHEIRYLQYLFSLTPNRQIFLNSLFFIRNSIFQFILIFLRKIIDFRLKLSFLENALSFCLKMLMTTVISLNLGQVVKAVPIFSYFKELLDSCGKSEA